MEYRSLKNKANIRCSIMKHIDKVGNVHDQEVLLVDIIKKRVKGAIPKLTCSPPLPLIADLMHRHRRWLNTNMVFVQDLMAYIPLLKPCLPYSRSKYYRDYNRCKGFRAVEVANKVNII